MRKGIAVLAGLMVSAAVFVGCGGGGDGGSSAVSDELETSEMTTDEIAITKSYETTLSNDMAGLKSELEQLNDTVVQDQNEISLTAKIGSKEYVFFNMDYVNSWKTTSLAAKTLRRNLDVSTVVPRVTTGKKALILRPFEFEQVDLGNPEYALGKAGYQVVVKENEDVTVDLLKTIDEYDFVYLITHGYPSGGVLHQYRTK